MYKCILFPGIRLVLQRSYLFTLAKVYNELHDYDTSLETFCTQFPALVALITHLYESPDFFPWKVLVCEFLLEKSFVRMTKNTRRKINFVLAHVHFLCVQCPAYLKRAITHIISFTKNLVCSCLKPATGQSLQSSNKVDKEIINGFGNWNIKSIRRNTSMQ